jgi:hypothetical protein
MAPRGKVRFFAIFGAVAGIVAFVFQTILGGFLDAYMSELGWYNEPGNKVRTAVNAISFVVPYLPWIGGALIGFGIGVWFDFFLKKTEQPKVIDSQFRKWPDPYSPELIRGKHFINQRVNLDGHRYYECSFENITFVYNGTTAVQVQKCKFTGGIMLASDNVAVTGAFFAAHAFGLTKDVRIVGIDPALNRIEPLSRDV